MLCYTSVFLHQTWAFSKPLPFFYNHSSCSITDKSHLLEWLDAINHLWLSVDAHDSLAFWGGGVPRGVYGDQMKPREERGGASPRKGLCPLGAMPPRIPLFSKKGVRWSPIGSATAIHYSPATIPAFCWVQNKAGGAKRSDFTRFFFRLFFAYLKILVKSAFPAHFRLF